MSTYYFSLIFSYFGIFYAFSGHFAEKICIFSRRRPINDCFRHQITSARPGVSSDNMFTLGNTFTICRHIFLYVDTHFTVFGYFRADLSDFYAVSMWKMTISWDLDTLPARFWHEITSTAPGLCSKLMAYSGIRIYKGRHILLCCHANFHHFSVNWRILLPFLGILL